MNAQHILPIRWSVRNWRPQITVLRAARPTARLLVVRLPRREHGPGGAGTDGCNPAHLI